MVDIGGGNLDLQKTRIEMEIAQARTNIAAARYRLAQIDDERRQVLINIEATIQQVTELESTLSNLLSEV